jgi:cytochrome c oxidase assembly protein subunit 17
LAKGSRASQFYGGLGGDDDSYPPPKHFKTTTMGNTQQTPKDEKKVQPKVGKSGKKICCSCPDTKSLRDACTLENGPESDLCKELIEKHKECLRGEGFIVK